FSTPGKAPQASVRSEHRAQRELRIGLAARGGPHRREGTAVDGRRPELANGGEVRARRVAHVAREAVARVAPVERAHERVAVHLGDDRGGGDRAHERVALGIGALRHREVGDLTPVDEHEAGHERQPRDRPPARAGAFSDGAPRLPSPSAPLAKSGTGCQSVRRPRSASGSATEAYCTGAPAAYDALHGNPGRTTAVAYGVVAFAPSAG